MAVDLLVDLFAMVGREMLPWTLTYLLHSSLALGAVWLVARWWGLPVSSEAVLWKVALFGSVLTAVTQVWTGVGNPVGELHVEVPGASRQGRAGAVVAPGTRSTIPSFGERQAGPAEVKTTAPDSRTARTGVTGSRNPSGSPSGGGFPWTACLLPLWALGTGALLARILFTHQRFHRALRSRRSIDAPHLRRTLEKLTERAGVRREIRLSASESLPAPAVLGRREICLPEHLLSALDRRSQKSALAHEVGHVAHRDPQWSLASSLATAFLFFQPLNWIAARRIRRTAEFLADDWAVRQGASGLDLARCLSEVASWSVSLTVSRGPATSAVLEDGGALVARTRRLLHPGGTGSHTSTGPRLIGGVALLGALVATTPSIEVVVPGPTAEPETREEESRPLAVAATDGEEPRGTDARRIPSLDSIAPVEQRHSVTEVEDPPPEAVLRTGTDAERLRGAGRTLTKEDPTRAVRVFLEIIKERPGTRARTVAIRALRGLPDSLSLPALDTLARRHPDAAVREEAAEWATAKRSRRF